MCLNIDKFVIDYCMQRSLLLEYMDNYSTYASSALYIQTMQSTLTWSSTIDVKLFYTTNKLDLLHFFKLCDL